MPAVQQCYISRPRHTYPGLILKHLQPYLQRHLLLSSSSSSNIPIPKWISNRHNPHRKSLLITRSPASDPTDNHITMRYRATKPPLPATYNQAANATSNKQAFTKTILCISNSQVTSCTGYSRSPSPSDWLPEGARSPSKKLITNDTWKAAHGWSLCFTPPVRLRGRKDWTGPGFWRYCDSLYLGYVGPKLDRLNLTVAADTLEC